MLTIIVSAVCYAEDSSSIGVWEKEVSLGYTQATGNTQNSQLLGALNAYQKTGYNEVTFKLSSLYATQDKKMNAQKHSGSLRYGFSFWDKEWYGFLKFQADHDKFANVDYRIVPYSGIGYWFFDTEQWKLLFEIGLGFEYIEYSNRLDEDINTVCAPRLFFEKQVFDAASISQDITIFNNLEQGERYRIHSETKFTNPLSQTIALRCSFIDEFNSDPAGDVKKNDTNLLLSLVYAF